MKLHANAALSSRQRERMVLRVVEHGWALTKAAEWADGCAVGWPLATPHLQ
jgi:hypothetical protein